MDDMVAVKDLRFYNICSFSLLPDLYLDNWSAFY